jgi:glucosamine--fructose-6-phosphate aminotransferase (isomerizing)
MCGIFGIVSDKSLPKSITLDIVTHSRQRGKDSSGLMVLDATNQYSIFRADYDIVKLLKEVKPFNKPVIFGHSRLITNGLSDNQPVISKGVCVLHNGIIVNYDEIWPTLSEKRQLNIDTEVIAGIANDCFNKGWDVEKVPERILELCKGVVACALIIPHLGKLCLFSNNGSLYLGDYDNAKIFASEEYPLVKVGCKNIIQIKKPIFLDIPKSSLDLIIKDKNDRTQNLIPNLPSLSQEEKLLKFEVHSITRCTKCILPATMPYIKFDEDGVCNYCRNYKLRNIPKPKDELFKLVESYRKPVGNDCIVPFSGGRDSCYGLHLIVNELGMKPVTYTYDWGMVTDLGRRNISRMCAELGVENIIVADDIAKKRHNIKMNLKAWLKAPNLGMISIFTAGDKHFFRHIESIKKQTGISLNLWGVNPLEVTHFKSGFLGVPPDFEEKNVYSNGALKQLRYQFLRLKAMVESPGYFNSSLWDTLSGEYYRSFHTKTDYYHIFDYWRWDENIINQTLEKYEWEKSPDTNTTWRIGDGTAAFYNYIYYTVAGFTEHDTFRSNQIREGDMSREKALELVLDENMPRYQNIKWYLDALGMDFNEVITTVNKIPKLY